MQKCLFKTLQAFTELHLEQIRWLVLMVSPLGTLLPQALSLWISELCRDPPPILGLTPEAEGLVVAVITSALVITASSLAISYCPASR